MSGQRVKTVLVLSESEEFQNELIGILRQYSSLDYVLDAGSIDQHVVTPASSAPTVIILDLNDCNDSNFSDYKKILFFYKHAIIIGVRYPSDTALVVRLLKEGVQHFIEYPVDPGELKVLMETPRPVSPAASRESKSAKMISLFSAKGGIGVTFLAINFAAALAKNKNLKVALCDISPGWGDVATCLNMTPKYTLRDLIDQGELLDASYVQGVVLRHGSGIDLISAPREDQTPILAHEAPQFESFLSLFKEAYDVVLIDCGHADPSLIQIVAKHSDAIILIANQDVPSLRGLVGSFDKFNKASDKNQLVRVVINRDDARFQMGGVIKEFEKRTSQKIALRLPNNYSLAIEAINRGCTVYETQPHSGFWKQMDAFINKLLVELLKSPGTDKADTSLGIDKAKKKGFFPW